MTNNFITGYSAAGTNTDFYTGWSSAQQLPGTNGTYLIGATALRQGVKLPEPTSSPEVDSITIFPVQYDITVYPWGTNGFFNYGPGINEVLVKAGNMVTFLAAPPFPASNSDPDSWFTYPNPTGGVQIENASALPPNLITIDTIYPATGQIIIGSNGLWVGESGTTALTSLNAQEHSPILDSISAIATNGFLYIDNSGNVFADNLVASGDVSGTSSGTNITLSINTNSVTYAKIQPIGTQVLLGNPFNLSLNVSEITLGSNLEFSGNSINVYGLGTGSVTTVNTGTGLIDGPFNNNGTVSVNAHGITYSLMQQTSGSNVLLGGLSAGATISEIPIGSGLAFTLGTLHVGSTVVFGPGPSTSNAIAAYTDTSGTNLQNTNITIDSNNTLSINKDSSNVKSSKYVLYNTTTDATLTKLYLDGSSLQLLLNNNTTTHFNMQIVGRRTGTAGSNFVASYSGTISRDANAATTALIGDVEQNISIIPNSLDWTVSITADTVNGALSVAVTGDSLTNILWGAVVETIEITG